MISQAEPVVLTGEAALSFANSLFRPTREETERRNAVMEKIDRDVTITEHEDGFSADVSWLDLSFLEKEFSSSNRELELTMETSTERASFAFFDGIAGNTPYILVGARFQREETTGGVLLSCAA